MPKFRPMPENRRPSPPPGPPCAHMTRRRQSGHAKSAVRRPFAVCSKAPTRPCALVVKQGTCCASARFPRSGHRRRPNCHTGRPLTRWIDTAALRPLRGEPLLWPKGTKKAKGSATRPLLSAKTPNKTRNPPKKQDAHQMTKLIETP